jgi:hypothetical protein
MSGRQPARPHGPSSSVYVWPADCPALGSLAPACPCLLLPVTFAARMAAKPIPPKKNQGGRSCGPPVPMPAVAGLAACSNPIPLKKSRHTGKPECRRVSAKAANPEHSQVQTFGVILWGQSLALAVPAIGYIIPTCTPGRHLWGRSFGSPARSALHLVIGTGFGPGHHRGQLWGCTFGVAPVVPAIGCIANPGHETTDRVAYEGPAGGSCRPVK